MPTASDLVTDLPADFEVFGQAVDTALMDLKGGTTGQVLKKNTNTDMDFVWAADSAGMTNPMTTTGDTIYSSSGSTPARLGIGSTGQVLTVAGGLPTWAAAGAPAKSFTLLSTLTLTGATTITTSSLTACETYVVFVIGAGTVNNNNTIAMRFNGDTSAKYGTAGIYGTATTMNGQTTVTSATAGNTSFDLAQNINTAHLAYGTATIIGAQGTGTKFVQVTAGSDTATGERYATSVLYSGASAISTISLVSLNGNFNAGTAYIWGA